MNVRIFRIVVTTTLLLAVGWIAVASIDREQLIETVKSLDAVNLGLTVFFLLLSSLFASLRVRSIAAGLGYSLSLRDSIAVLSLGQLGGAIFFQIFGQLAARGSYLSRRDVPFAGTVLITGQERIAAALVSLLLATIGALYLFRAITFDLNSGGTDLVWILVGLALAGIAAVRIWFDEIQTAFSSISAAGIVRVIISILYSGAVQLSMMGAYLCTGKALAPAIPLSDLTAAITLVMFASSIPISLAGWGVREISAVAALGAIGMKTAAAVSTAILIGVLSIALAGILALYSAHAIAIRPTYHHTAKPSGKTLHQNVLSKILPPLAATLVFFQILIPTGLTPLNANLADPIAILCGCIFILAHLRSQPPAWRISGINLHVLACTIVITLALLIGAIAVGWTQWAVTNKYLGWLVLLCYGATGAMATKFSFSKVLSTFISVGCAICILEIARALMTSLGFFQPVFVAGLSNNPNAFAFQCIMLLAASLAYRPPSIATIALALTGVWLSSSRSGICTAVIVMAVSTLMIDRSWRKIVPALFAASIIGAFLFLLPNFTGAHTSLSNPIKALTVGSASSTTEHLKSMIDGITMFVANPFFGAGLGTFIATWNGPYPLIIHSTSIWLLAEFGLFGALIFISPIVRIFIVEARKFRNNDVAGNLLVLIIAGFSAMSIFHEFMYQRTFWFLLGLALAHTVSFTNERRTSVQQALT
ncbi:MAG: flippase-like domain-containing protein [Afipia sp.]|nr:flippase-like domain-containing protein [Afipia sp.]